MAGAIIVPVLSLIENGLDLGTSSAALVVTTPALFIALSSLFAGTLIDRIGTKKPFILGLVLYGVAGGSGLIVTSYHTLILSRALLGIAVAITMTSITVLIMNLYEGEARNKIIGLRGSANNFGGVIWPITGGILGGISWRLPFAVYLVAIPLGVLALVTIPEARAGKTASVHQNETVSESLGDNPVIFAIYGLMFLASTLLYTIMVFLPQVLGTMGISNPVSISLFIAALKLSGGVASLIYARIRTMLSYKAIVLIALTLWTNGLIIISLTFSTVIIAVSVALFGIGHGILLPAIMGCLGESVPAPLRGRAVSYLGTFGFLGQFASPLILGPISLTFGLRGVFLMAGGASGLLLLATLGFFWSRDSGIPRKIRVLSNSVLHNNSSVALLEFDFSRQFSKVASYKKRPRDFRLLYLFAFMSFERSKKTISRSVPHPIPVLAFGPRIGIPRYHLLAE